MQKMWIQVLWWLWNLSFRSDNMKDICPKLVKILNILIKSIFGQTTIISKVQVVQWFSALAAMAMLSVRTRVQVPPTTSRVIFSCNKVSSLTNRTPTLTSVSCASIIQFKSYPGRIPNKKNCCSDQLCIVLSKCIQFDRTISFYYGVEL